MSVDKAMWNRFANKDDHLSFAQLLRISDGEVSETERRLAQHHLESCWACRAEMEKLGTAIAGVIEYRDILVEPHMPPPANGRTMFLAQLHHQATHVDRSLMGERPSLLSNLRSQWILPFAAAACSAAVLLAFVQRSHDGVSATRLLDEAEQRDAASVGALKIEHRTVVLEERDVDGKLIATSRIESWREKSRSARRLFDGTGRVIAGEWVEPDGSHVLMQRNKLKRFPSSTTPPVTSDDVWRLAPTPATFAALIGVNPAMTVEERPANYVIQSATQRVYGGLHLVRTSLTLRRGDYHATGQQIELESGGRLKSYRFLETGSELRPVAPALDTMLDVDVFRSPKTMHSALAATRSTPHASAMLKMDALRRLDEVNSFSTDQIKVDNTDEGSLRIEGVVATKGRLHDVIAALGPIVKDPAATVDIATAEEAILRVRRRPGHVQVQAVEIETHDQTINVDIAHYLSATRHVPEDQMQNSVLQYSYQVLDDIEQAQNQALALRQLTTSLPEVEVSQLTPSERKQWKELVSRHARQVRQAISAIRAELAPVFYPLGLSVGSAVPTNLTQPQATEQLTQIASTADNLLWQALSIGSDAAATRSLKNPEFWTSLANAERLAEEIQNH